MKNIFIIFFFLVAQSLYAENSCNIRMPAASNSFGEKLQEFTSDIIINNCEKGRQMNIILGRTVHHMTIIGKYCDLDKQVINMGTLANGPLGFMCTYNGNKEPLSQKDIPPESLFSGRMKFK